MDDRTLLVALVGLAVILAELAKAAIGKLAHRNGRKPDPVAERCECIEALCREMAQKMALHIQRSNEVHRWVESLKSDLAKARSVQLKRADLREQSDRITDALSAFTGAIHGTKRAGSRRSREDTDTTS